MATTYTKGGITFRRDDSGKLSRVDKPKKSISIGITKKVGGGETVIRPKSISRIKRGSRTITQSTFKLGNKTIISDNGSISMIKDKGSGLTTRINRPPTPPPSRRLTFLDINRQSVDPNKLLSRSTSPIRDAKGDIWGYVDYQANKTVGFNAPIKRQELLALEQSRQPIVRTVGRGVVAPVASVKKIDSAIEKAQQLRDQNALRLKGLKGNIGGGAELATVQAGANLIIYAFAGSVLKTARSVGYLPDTVKAVIANPAVLKQLPKELYKGGKNYVNVLKASTPTEAVAIVGSDIVIMRGLSSVIKTLSRLSGTAITRLNPKFVGSGRVGKVLNIKLPDKKIVSVRVVAKIPKETIKSQVAKAGKTVVGISSQQRALVGVLKRGRTIRKPIPGEAGFSKLTKSLLKKFDKGTLSRKEFSVLNNRLIKVEKSKGLLERSGFIDPTGKVRPSRLGIIDDKVAKLRDRLSANITFKKSKPQILLFNDLKVAKWPKRLLKIKNKVSKGQPLTKAEADELLTWQLSTPGSVKPLGFISGESELTIPPGSLVKRVKKVGVTLISGKSVPIVQVKVVKPSGDLKSFLSKWDKGVISSSELKKLSSLLKKKTGFDYGLSYKSTVNKRYVSIKRLLSSGATKSLSKSKTYSKGYSVGSKASKVSRVSKVKRISRSSTASKTSKAKSFLRPSRASKVSKASQSKALSSISKTYSPRTISKIKSIASKVQRRKTRKFTEEEIKYMLSKIYVKAKYRPSLAALMFNITGYKAPKNLTGFEIRPILKK